MPSENILGGHAMKSKKEIAEFWRHHVQAFIDSGKTRVAYCRENQIQVYQLDYWRRKFKSSKANKSPDIRRDWVSLQIHEDHSSDKGTGIRLHIGRLSIEVEPGFNPKLLSELLRVVGTAC